MTITSYKQIADMALLRLNRRPLGTNAWPPVGAEKEEVAVAAFWDLSIEEVTEDHDWADLLKEASIPKTTPTAGSYLELDNSPVFDLTAQKTAGLKRVWTVHPQQNWRREVDTLILEPLGFWIKDGASQSLSIRGTYLPASAAQIQDNQLVKALSYKLAQNMAAALRPDDSTLPDKMEMAYLRAVSMARGKTHQKQNNGEIDLFVDKPDDWTEGMA